MDLEDRISKVEQLEETLRQRDATIKDDKDKLALLEVSCLINVHQNSLFMSLHDLICILVVSFLMFLHFI